MILRESLKQELCLKDNKEIINKLRNVLCSPHISMNYNVITSKQDSERVAEAGTLFEGQQ